MARKTKMNHLTDPESIAAINKESAQLLSDFLEYLRSTQKSETTIAVYKNDIEIAFVWALKHIDNIPFPKWTKRNIVAFQNWLINENGNSPARVRRIKAALSSMSNFIEAVLDDEYKDFRNIINKVQSPIIQPVREKTVLSDEQLQHLLGELVDKEEYEKACMLSLAMCSGRRKSELVRFKRSYFDDDNIIFGSLFKTPETIKTKGSGKGKYLHCYTLANDFKPYLKLWLNELDERGVESEWLFPHHSDPTQHLNAQTLNSWADSFSKALNVDFYWHCLRHYFTTHLVREGLPDGIIQDIIGWSSADMLRLYTDISVDEQLGKYFDENGIKTVEHKGLGDI